MANNINTVKSNAAIIAKVAAGMLVDNLQFAKSISKADESDYNGKNGYSAGDTIQISKPARFIPTNNFNITSSIQDIVEEKVPLTLDILSTVGVSLDSQELASTINIKSIANRVIKPAVAAIAQDVEKTMLQRAINSTYNIVGNVGNGSATVFDTDFMLSASQKQQEFLMPMDGDNWALLSPAARRSAVNARKGLFNKSEEISKQYKSGYMGEADGYEYMSNNLIPRITHGTAAGAITVTTTSVNGATTIALTGTGTQTLVAGQVFTIANVNAVHPQTKVDLGYAQQFVVTANNTAVGGAYTGVAISPTIYDATTGKSLQNVTALPVSGATVTLVGTASTSYAQSLAFHTDAYRMVSVPLILPDAVEFAVQETYKGVSVAIVRAFDVLQRRMITRIDFLGGFAAVRPEWAVRLGS